VIARIIDMIEAGLGALVGSAVAVVIVELFWRTGAVSSMARTLRRMADGMDSPMPKRPPPSDVPTPRPSQFTPPEWARSTSAPPGGQGHNGREPSGAAPVAHRPAVAAAPLLQVSAGADSRRVELKGGLGGWVLGSSADAHIRLSPPVAAEQLLFQRTGESLVVVDLTADAKLVVDGRAVGGAPTTLRVGSIAEVTNVKVERIA
jgi:hypothetical protein